MSLFWKNNKNVILIAVAMFVASITGLLFFLSDEKFNHQEYKADVLSADHTETESEEQHEINYDELPELKEGPAVIIGMDGLVDFANREYEEQSQYDNEEMVDKLFFSYVHPDDLADMLSKYGQVIASEEPESVVGPYRLKNADGKYELYMASLKPVEADNKMLGVAVSTLSIAESVKQEEYIEEEPVEEEKYTEEDNEEVVEKNHNVAKTPEKPKEEVQNDTPATEDNDQKEKETPPPTKSVKKTIKNMADDVKKDIPPPKTDPSTDEENNNKPITVEEQVPESETENSAPVKKDDNEDTNTDSNTSDSANSKADTPKNEAPQKNTPKSETPKKEPPKKAAPKKESPKKEAPKNEPPGKESPKKEKKYKLF
jgi:PAS domain S-box-containing protein